MRRFTKWLKRWGVWVLLVAFSVTALSLDVVYWHDQSKTSVIGSLFGFITTALLVGITYEYVRLNQRSVRLMQRQWKQQNELEVLFGVSARQGKARIWVANLGLPNVLIGKAVIRSTEGKLPTVYKNMIVVSGRKRRFDIPSSVWEGTTLMKHIEVNLHYESSTFQSEQTRAYTLYVDESKVYKVRKGLRHLWPVGCPKCEKFYGMCMITDGLKTFAAAEERQKLMEADLIASCPEHKSQWMLTTGHVNRLHSQASNEMDD